MCAGNFVIKKRVENIKIVILQPLVHYVFYCTKGVNTSFYKVYHLKEYVNIIKKNS